MMNSIFKRQGNNHMNSDKEEETYEWGSLANFTIQLQRANDGDVDSMFELGKLYTSGEFRNRILGRYWLGKVHENGHKTAMELRDEIPLITSNRGIAYAKKMMPSVFDISD